VEFWLQTKKNTNRNRYIIVTLILYLINTFVWTPIFYKYIIKLFQNSFIYIPSQQLAISMSSLVMTTIGELFFPIVLYFAVVRPGRLQPLLGLYPKRHRWILLSIMIIVTYSILTPWSNVSQLLWRSLISGTTFIIVGLCEEWSSRGVMMRVIKDRFGIIWASIFTSVLFGISHWAELMFFQKLAISERMILNIFLISLSSVISVAIVWIGRSIVWMAVIHALNDWNVIMIGHQSILLTWLYLPAFGLIGAIILRFYSSSRYSIVPSDVINDI